MRILIIILISFISKANCQEKKTNIPYQTKWANEVKKGGTDLEEKGISLKNTDGTFNWIRLNFGRKIMFANNSPFKMVKFDKSMISKCTLDLKDKFKIDKEEYVFVSAMNINDITHVISFCITKEEDLKVAAFPLKGCAIDKKGIFIEPISVKDEKTEMKSAVYDGATYMASKKPDCYIKHSENNKYTLVYCRVGNITLDNQKVIFLVLDDQFKKISLVEKLIPIKYADLQFESVNISNDGIPSALIINKLSTELFNPNEKLFRHILVGDQTGISFNKLSTDEIIKDAKLATDFNNKLKFIGLVSLDSKINFKLAGIVCSDISKTGELENKIITNLDSKFYSENKIDDKANKKNYEINSIQFNQKGEFFLSVEQFEEIKSSSVNFNSKGTAARSSVQYTDRIYSNIIVFNYNSLNNELNWSKLIEKEQSWGSGLSNYASFYSRIVNNKLAIMYNDNPANYKKESNGTEKNEGNLKKAVLAFKLIGKDGIETFDPIFNGKNENCFMKPMSFSNLDESKIVMYGNSIGKEKTGLLTLNDIIISNSATSNSTTSNPSNSITSKDTSKDKSTVWTTKTPTPANTSAIAHGEAQTQSAAVAKNYKYKADESSVNYYQDLRKKFEEEDKVRKEKEALMVIENAKKDEEAKQGRRLSEDKAPQFDKYRQGEKNAAVKKTTAEEDYKVIFK